MIQLVVRTSEEYWLLLTDGNSRTLHTTQPASPALHSAPLHSDDWIFSAP